MRTKNQETLDRILKFVNKYYQEHHSSPTINDVAEGVGVARWRNGNCADTRCCFLGIRVQGHLRCQGCAGSHCKQGKGMAA